MASGKISFVPSISESTTGYNLWLGSSKYATSLFLDLGMPPIVDGRMTAVVPDLPLAESAFSVKAYNSVGEESPPSNFITFDPRIEPPTELVVEDV